MRTRFVIICLLASAANPCAAFGPVHQLGARPRVAHVASTLGAPRLCSRALQPPARSAAQMSLPQRMVVASGIGSLVAVVCWRVAKVLVSSTLAKLAERDLALRDLATLCEEEPEFFDECVLLSSVDQAGYKNLGWFRKLFDTRLVNALEIAEAIRRPYRPEHGASERVDRPMALT
jgi:hypothetical protein